MSKIFRLLLALMVVGVLVQAHDNKDDDNDDDSWESMYRREDGIDGDLGSVDLGSVDHLGSGMPGEDLEDLASGDKDLGSGMPDDEDLAGSDIDLESGMPDDEDLASSDIDLESGMPDDEDLASSDIDLESGMPGDEDLASSDIDLESGMPGDGDLFGMRQDHQLWPRRRWNKKSHRQGRPRISKIAKRHGKRKSKKAKRHLWKRQCKVNNCAACRMFGCVRCKTGFTLIKTSFFNKRCVSNCPPGQKHINGKCTKNVCRGIPHCVKCRNAIIPWLRKCEKCEKGYYSYKGTYSIKSRCVKKCPSGYKGVRSMKGSFCKKIQRKCRLMPGCEKCPTIDTCLTCARNLSLHHGMMKSSCLNKCPRGFDSVVKNGIRLCQLEEGCGDRFCAMCKKGWLKIHFRGRKCHKQCPVGYYPVAKHFCNRCPRGCKKCSSMFRCDSCSKGFAKFNRSIFGSVVSTRCVSRCPRGYKKEFVNGYSVCQQICLVANCQTCHRVGHSGIYHHCDTCKHGHRLLKTYLNDKCVRRCPDGYHFEKVYVRTVCISDSLRPTTDWPTTKPFEPTPIICIFPTTVSTDPPETESWPTTWFPETTEPMPTTWIPEPETTEPMPTTWIPEPETTEPMPTTWIPEPETTEPMPTTWIPEPETTSREPEPTTTKPETTTEKQEPSTAKFIPEPKTERFSINETEVMAGSPWFPDP